MERKKANVRKETNAVSGMRVRIMHKNRHRKPPYFLSHQSHEVQVFLGNEVSEARVELDLFVTVMLPEETPAVLSLGKLCEDHGYTYHWTSRQLTKKGKRIDCNMSNYVPCVVQGLSTSSSAPSTTTSSTSSSKDSKFDVSRYTENPATEKSGSSSEELRGNPVH